MNYQKYQNARNISWKLLLDLKINSLPVKITAILKALEIPIYKYGDSQTLIQNRRLDGLTQTSDGFTIAEGNRCFIFYNEKQTAQRLRFTLAHELGHILCGHLGKTEGFAVTIKNREPSANDGPEEQEANVFASRLLAPACVLHELGLFTAKEIAEHCQISIQSATFRLEQLLELERRQQEFLQTKGHGCFYLHPLEREVYNQFKDYIDKNKL